ncbi:retrovirus-related pol polyprotein from transposon TNT 1-94 [Tanacetum coccineum]
MVPKTKDWVERLNPDSKLPNFNTGRILVPESQAVNESLETSNTHESSKDLKAEFLTPLPPLKTLQGASPSSEVMPLTFQPYSPKERPGLGIIKNTKPETQDSPNESVSGTVTINESKQTTPSVPTKVKDTEQEILYCMICKREDHRTSDHEMYIASLKRSEKAQPYQYASSSKQILRAKAKPFPPCTHCGFNDHMPDDCRNYPECEICGSYDHFTLGHNCVIQIRERVLAESSQSDESSIGVKCNTCGSIVHSTFDHNEFDHFKRETRQEVFASSSYGLVWTNGVDNQNECKKSKQIRTYNGTKFRNQSFESFCDEKEFLKFLLYAYTPEQNGVAERRNKTLIEAARTMLNGSILSNHFWTDSVRTACYTQNRSIIVKRHDKTSYEIFRERIPDISYFHVLELSCSLFINHKDHPMQNFDAKAYDGLIS